MAASHERLRLGLDILSTTALVITAAVVISMSLNRPSATPSAPTTAGKPPLAESVDLVVASKGQTMGSGHAKLAIIEFSDFQCPYCARFAKDTLPQIKREFIEPGVAEFIYRNNPLTIHPFAKKASAAAECAGQQRHYWEMHDALFSQQRDLSDGALLARAGALHLDISSFTSCLNEGAAARISEDQADAAQFGLQSTPIFLIGRIQPDGSIKVKQRINGAAPYQTFKAALTNLM
jgi:protein-disulfide isomerase